MRLRQWRPAVAGVLIVLLSGCVTTTSSPRQAVDLEKAEETHIQAGLGYLRQKDKDSARRHFQKALDIDSRSAGACNGMALVYQAESDLDKAEEYFQRAVRYDASFSLARNNYAAMLYSQGRFSEAAKQLRVVADDYDYERRELALLNLGRTELKLGDFSAAEEALKQAVGINPRLGIAHLELADLYFQQEKYTLSRSSLARYSKVARHSARSLWLGIRLERHFGDSDKEASYELALRNLHPNSAEYREYKKSME